MSLSRWRKSAYRIGSGAGISAVSITGSAVRYSVHYEKLDDGDDHCPMRNKVGTRHQEIYKSADRAEISTFDTDQHVKQQKHDVRTA